MPPKLSFLLLLLFAIFSYGEAVVSSCYDATNTTETCKQGKDSSCRMSVDYDKTTGDMKVDSAGCAGDPTRAWNAEVLSGVRLYCGTDNCNRLDEKNAEEMKRAICSAHPEICRTTPVPIKPKRKLRFSEEYGLYFIIGLGIYDVIQVIWIGFLVRWLKQFDKEILAAEKERNVANARNRNRRNSATNPLSAQNANKKANIAKSKSFPLLVPRKIVPRDAAERERNRLIDAGLLVRPQADDESVKEVASDWGSYIATVQPPRRRRRHDTTTEE